MEDIEFSWSQTLERTDSINIPFSIYAGEDQSVYLTADHYISKYNPNGTQAWKKTYLDNPEDLLTKNHDNTVEIKTISAIDSDENGSIYICGYITENY